MVTKELKDKIKESLTDQMKVWLEIAQSNGASCWLTALPIKNEGFHLTNGILGCYLHTLRLANSFLTVNLHVQQTFRCLSFKKEEFVTLSQ